MRDNFKETFKEEAIELLAEMEALLLNLEKEPENGEVIGGIFRALHTLKGSGAMAGYDNIAALAHEVESIFEMVRRQRVSVSRPLVDLTLASGDLIRKMLAPSKNEEPVLGSRAADIIASLKALAPVSDSFSKSAPEQPQSLFDTTGKPVVYRISFRPHRDIFGKGANLLLLLDELGGLGQCTVVACLDAIPFLTDLNPEECYTYWEVILTTNLGMNTVRDVFIFVEDDCELKIEAVEENADLCDVPYHRRLGEILVERGDVVREEVERVLGEQKRVGERLIDAGLVPVEKVEAALAEQQHLREIREKQKEEHISTIRVPAARLDTLVDLVGELVTVQASLAQLASQQRKIPQLRSIAEHVNRLTMELRDNTMTIRMLPIGTTFKRFSRLVRDLSDELGKEVVIVTDGEETELDKTVIERLNDPLVHLVRNSIDHGIESPGERTAAGKPGRGTIRLSAAHSGANVLVSISDDGAGLDHVVIRAKAVEAGLVPPNVELSEREIYSLIFAPGFSTATKVSSVSGRGVGMDVVKRSIEALGGLIDISSQKGRGTTITLRLPLTLAIVDGLLVRIGKSYFVLPLSAVEECIELSRKDVVNANGRHVTNLRGKILPYIRLRDRFAINAIPPPAIEQIVVTEVLGDRVGFVVDKVIGEHQTVIKSMGKVFKSVEGISGATILGDGTVALILDVPKLVQATQREELNGDGQYLKVQAV